VNEGDRDRSIAKAATLKAQARVSSRRISSTHEVAAARTATTAVSHSVTELSPGCLDRRRLSPSPRPSPLPRRLGGEGGAPPLPVVSVRCSAVWCAAESDERPATESVAMPARPTPAAPAPDCRLNARDPAPSDDRAASAATLTKSTDKATQRPQVILRCRGSCPRHGCQWCCGAKAQRMRALRETRNDTDSVASIRTAWRQFHSLSPSKYADADGDSEQTRLRKGAHTA